MSTKRNISNFTGHLGLNKNDSKSPLNGDSHTAWAMRKLLLEDLFSSKLIHLEATKLPERLSVNDPIQIEGSRINTSTQLASTFRLSIIQKQYSKLTSITLIGGYARLPLAQGHHLQTSQDFAKHYVIRTRWRDLLVSTRIQHLHAANLHWTGMFRSVPWLLHTIVHIRSMSFMHYSNPYVPNLDRRTPLWKLTVTYNQRQNIFVVFTIRNCRPWFFLSNNKFVTLLSDFFQIL